ncbi:MAG: phosphoglycerate dehydrogenase [Chthoniobacterales bacterium]
MKILITTSSFGVKDTASKDILISQGCQIITNPHGRTLTEEEVDALLKEHRPDGMIAGVEPLTENVLTNAAPHLRVISRCGTGLDNVNLEIAKKRGITVVNTPDAPAEAVAELTLAFILALIRNITVHDSEVKSGRWKKHMGYLLHEMTIGLVGLGRVGKRVASLLQPYGCKLLGADLKPDQDWAATHRVELMPIEQLLTQADVITLHLPYATAELHHFINKKRIASMKPGSFLINTSRGALVDDNALAAALEDGHLGGIALDVYEEEPYLGPLLKAPRTILSPHSGSYARATRTRMECEAAKNLLTELARSSSK